MELLLHNIPTPKCSIVIRASMNWEFSLSFSLFDFAYKLY